MVPAFATVRSLTHVDAWRQIIAASFDFAYTPYSISDLAEMGTDLRWDDPETVAWLRESWQEARPRLEQVWALVDWCSPQAVGPPDSERLDAIVDLVLRAYPMERSDD